MCILHIHIYTYIFVTYTEMYTVGARFIVLPINRRIIYIFSNPKVICVSLIVCRIFINRADYFSFGRKHPIQKRSVGFSPYYYTLLYNVEVVAEIVFVDQHIRDNNDKLYSTNKSSAINKFFFLFHKTRVSV